MRSTRLARTIVEDHETATQTVVQLAATAPELRELTEQLMLEPDRIDRIEVESERESSSTPDEWDD